MTAQSAGLEQRARELLAKWREEARRDCVDEVETQILNYCASELEAALAAAPAADGWVLVPRIGTEVAADHPITCLNPTPTFDVVAVEVDSLGARARGENTCWFGVSMLAAAPQAQGEG